MKRSVGRYECSRDQLHWTRAEARNFAQSLENQMNHILQFIPDCAVDEELRTILNSPCSVDAD